MNRHLKTGDRALLAVLGVVLVLGLVWFGFSLANGRKTSVNGMVVVTQSKDGFRRVDRLSDAVEFTVETPGTGTGSDADGGRNTVRIRDGQVDVTSANCSNQICVDHEPIAAEGEQIVCLPHGVVVEIVANEADATKLQ